jgi:K+-transporting ATPase ATPase A chain
MGLFFTILLLIVTLALCWRYLGAYMVAVFQGRVRWLAPVERVIYKVLRTNPESEQTWARYAGSIAAFTGVSMLLTYLVLVLQGHLPFNPQHLGDVNPVLAFNTVTSFVTNTNWQNYGGETTMSYFSQMLGLEFHQFLSAAVGLVIAIAVIRGFSHRGKPTIGNFWVDTTRATLYILFPISFVLGLVFVGQGAIDTLAGPVHVHDVLNGVSQIIPLGPTGFMEAIKQLGTNGGGFFNANSAHPFENPTGLTNFLSMLSLLSIPFALTYVFGKMVGSVRQGVAVLVTMVVLFGAWVGMAAFFEHQPNPAVSHAHVASLSVGNTEGKETRFGDTTSAITGVACTMTSTGCADSAYDSYTPLGGFALISGMMLGEVSPGGVGSGMYTFLLFAIIAVFIGGLMIGRTPEYLGKKIQAKEVQLAGIGVLVMPVTVLVMTAIAVSLHQGTSAVENGGPHGFTEILYGFTSMTNNNGSAFGGLTASGDFYQISGAIVMLIGRFGVAFPALALAGSLANKQVAPAGLGTFRTDTGIFVGLLLGVILIVGGLTFFPALALGPLVEQLSHLRFWP